MSDSAQINIDTAEALKSVDSLVKKMDKLVKVSQAFDNALTNHIINPVQQSADALNKVANSAKTVAAVFASVGSSINDAFKNLHSTDLGKIPAIDELRTLVKEFVKIGKLDKGSNLSGLSKSLLDMSKSLSALSSLNGSFDIDPTIAPKIAEFINQFKIITGFFEKIGIVSVNKTEANPVYIIRTALEDFSQVAKAMSSFTKGLRSIPADGFSIAPTIAPKIAKFINQFKIITGFFGKIGIASVNKTEANSVYIIRTALEDFSQVTKAMSSFTRVLRGLPDDGFSIDPTIAPKIAEFINQFKIITGFFEKIGIVSVNKTEANPVYIIRTALEDFSQVAKAMSSFTRVLRGIPADGFSIDPTIAPKIAEFINQFKIIYGYIDLSKELGGFSSKKHAGGYVGQSQFEDFKKISRTLTSMTRVMKVISNMDFEVNNNIAPKIAAFVNQFHFIIDYVAKFDIEGVSSPIPSGDVSRHAFDVVSRITRVLASLTKAMKILSAVDFNIDPSTAPKIAAFINQFKFIQGILRQSLFSSENGAPSNAYIGRGSFADFERMAKGLQTLSRSMSVLTKVGGADGAELDWLIDKIQALFNWTTKMAKDPSFVYFERMANAMHKVSMASKNLVTATDKTQKAFKKLGEETKRTKTWIENMHPVVRQLFTAFAGYNVIYGFVRSVQHAVREMADLEDRMARVNTIARGNKQQLAAWTQGVMNLSSAYGLAKNALTQALYDINSATITGSKAFLVLEQASKAAVAGFTDVSKISELLARIINAYGYSASDAGRLSDILFKAVERGINPMEELAQYMGRVLTVASNAGVSFEEVSAAIATMTSRGLQTNIAVTALNSAILKLSQGSSKLNAVFQQYGYASSAAAVQTGGLVEAVRILQQATGGATEALTKLGFNYRDIRAMTVLASGAFSEFNHNLQAMNDAEGATDDALKKRADTLQMKWNRLKETISNSLIAVQQWAGASEVFKGVLDMLNNVVVSLTRIVTASHDVLTPFEKWVKLGLKIAVHIMAFKMLYAVIYKAVKQVIAIHTAFKSLKVATATWSRIHNIAMAKGVSSLKVYNRALKLTAGSIKAARIQAVIFKGAVMGIAGIGMAALEFTAFAALEGILTRSAEKAKEIKDISEELASDLGKNLNDLRGLTSLGYTGELNSESLKAAKDKLSEVKANVASIKQELDGLKENGRSLSKFARHSLWEAEQQLQYYTDLVKKMTDALDEHSLKKKQWIKIESSLSFIIDARKKSLEKDTNALSKYVSALSQQKRLYDSLRSSGIDLDLLEGSPNKFKTHVKALFSSEKLSESVTQDLIDYGKTFETIGKNVSSATSEIARLEKQLQSLTRLRGGGVNFGKELSKGMVNSLLQYKATDLKDLASYSGFENTIEQLKDKVARDNSLDKVIQHIFIPFDEQKKRYRAYSENPADFDGLVEEPYLAKLVYSPELKGITHGEGANPFYGAYFNKAREVLMRSAPVEQNMSRLKKALFEHWSKENLQEFLVRDFNKNILQLQTLWASGQRDAVDAFLANYFETDGKLDYDMVAKIKNDIEKTVTPIDKLMNGAFIRLKKGDSLTDILAELNLTPEQTDDFVQTMNKLLPELSTLVKTLEDLQKLSDKLQFSALTRTEQYTHALSKYNEIYQSIMAGNITEANLKKYQEAAQTLVNSAQSIKAVKVPAEIAATDAVRAGSDTAAQLLKKQLYTPSIKVNKSILEQTKKIREDVRTISEFAKKQNPFLEIVAPSN